MMAHDIFSMLMPSESYFRSTNRILTYKRSRLGAMIFKRLVCLKDWVDAEQRNQHALVEAPSSCELMTDADGQMVYQYFKK
jgi:hypothetical protein